jgi:hypothetical protein
MFPITKSWFSGLSFIIYSFLCTGSLCFFWVYAPKFFCHLWTCVFIFGIIYVEINSRHEKKIGVEKTKEELDLEYGRGLILIFAAILCAVACSLLNWALWGETKINIGIVGSISVFAAMFMLLHFYVHIEKANTKSKKERALIAGNLGDLSISQQNHHNELIEIISLTNLKISRIETVHGFFYTTEQIKNLYKDNIPLNVPVWKAKQIEAYYRIMTGKGIRPADHDEFKDHDGKYLSMKVQAYTMNELYPELMGKSRENMIRQSRKEVKQAAQLQNKLMSEHEIKN